MKIALWFVGGFVLAAAVVAGALYLYKLKASNHKSLPPESLPKSWDSLMPSDGKAKTPILSRRSTRNSKPFMKTGSTKSSGIGTTRKAR